MATIRLQVSFESLIEAITSLSLEQKRELMDILEEQMSETEEDLAEQNPQIIAEIAEAREAYKKGDYKTIQEYLASRSNKS
ncbi:hypothetical protein NIES4071_39390 [Calothrix sp. NIES-4071]|nr:hypothetical protein NIES4071_39390 [Calothrix sp. NIES-4071]BAZ58257.1 hypothetical protein NIES4105_39330 [Calothrix sp. NIES-4105]